MKKEEEKEKKENCHLLITARRTDEGRDKNENISSTTDPILPKFLNLNKVTKR